MSLPKRHVEQIIFGLYDQINLHLVKLVAFDFGPELRQHFRRELRSWFAKIQRLRMKPHNRSGSFKFYFDLLFDYPFGGVEAQNMTSMMALIAREHENARPAREPEEMVAWLKAFHKELAARLHAGEDVLDLVPK